MHFTIYKIVCYLLTLGLNETVVTQVWSFKPCLLIHSATQTDKFIKVHKANYLAIKFQIHLHIFYYAIYSIANHVLHYFLVLLGVSILSRMIIFKVKNFSLI